MSTARDPRRRSPATILAAWSLAVLGSAFAAAADNVQFGAPVAGSGGCWDVPVDLVKTSTATARTISVTIQLDANLVLCGTTSNSFTRGAWLNGWGTGTFFAPQATMVTGQYKIDQSVQGSPCGPTSGGRLFTVSVKQAGAPTSGTLSLGSTVVLLGCDNAPLAATATGTATVDFGAGSPVDPPTSFSAARKLTGNDTDGTTKTVFTFTLPANATGIEIHAAPFGNYPEFDDAAPGATLEQMNFTTATGAVAPSYETDRGLAYDAARGFGWRTTNFFTTDRALNPGDPRDSYAYAFNGTAPAIWEIATAGLGAGPYVVRVVCGDPVTQQRAVVSVEGVTFLDNVLTNGGFYAEATQTVTPVDGFLTVKIGGPAANTPVLSHTKLCFLEIRAASGGGPAGSVPPAVTSFPPGPRYTLLGSAATSPATFELAVRDYYYYVAYATNGANRSTPVSIANGLLNYHSGDFARSGVECSGDNAVDVFDLGFFSQNYGLTIPDGDSRACLDIAALGSAAPTTGLPATDNAVDVFDLNLFTTNYGVVSKGTLVAVPAAVNAVVLEEVGAGDGPRADLRMQGAGDVRTVALRLAWNPAVVEPIGSLAGDWLEAQAGMALQPSPGAVDCALLGAREVGLAGTGFVASVRFRRLQPGDAGLALVTALGFDLGGNLLQIDIGAQPTDVQGAPRVTAILGNAPNPFNPSTKIAFALADRDAVELAIYSLAGRHVKTLLRETRAAGRHEVIWDGTDGDGRAAASGVYYARLVTAARVLSRPLVLVK